MPISSEQIIHMVLKVIADRLSFPQPLANYLAERFTTYLLEKAIDPTEDSIRKSLDKFINLLPKAIDPTEDSIRKSLDKFMNEQPPIDKHQSQASQDVLTPEELLEKANKDSAKEAGIQIAKNHIDLFMKIRSDFQVGSDTTLLSGNINKLSDVPTEIKQQIVDLRAKFGRIINAVALHIEEKKYESAEQAISDMQSRGEISGSQKATIQKLVTADKTFHISCQSLKVTIDFFKSLNEHIVDEIENCSDANQELRLVLGNAVLVYELTDFVIKYLQTFQTQGVTDIKSVKLEIDRKVQKIQAEINELKNRANRDGIFPELKQNILSNISDREKAVVEMKGAWENYLGEVDTISGETIGFIDQWIPNLELIRDDAENQIDALEVFTIVRVLKSNLIALRTAVTRLETIKLVSLSPDRVRRLLGI